MTETNKRAEAAGSPAPAHAPKTSMMGRTKVTWDDASMVTTYANVSNVATTREEFMLLFGVSQAWTNQTDEVTVELKNRVLLSPFAAKRFLLLLAKTVEEYEKANGSLD